MKIVQLDGYALNPGDISMNDFSALGEFITFPRTAVNEVVERLKDADAVLTNKVQLTSEVLRQLPKLKYIGVMATGYNVVDIDAAKKVRNRCYKYSSLQHRQRCSNGFCSHTKYL